MTVVQSQRQKARHEFVADGGGEEGGLMTVPWEATRESYTKRNDAGPSLLT